MIIILKQIDNKIVFKNKNSKNSKTLSRTKKGIFIFLAISLNYFFLMLFSVSLGFILLINTNTSLIAKEKKITPIIIQIIATILSKTVNGDGAISPYPTLI